MAGLPVGTCFHAQESPLENRKRWIFGAPPAGKSPSMRARPRRSSKEAARCCQRDQIVSGNFSRGEVIRIRNSEGRDIAHGVSRYSDALRLIAGQHSQQIDAILGYEYGPGGRPPR